MINPTCPACGFPHREPPSVGECLDLAVHAAMGNPVCGGEWRYAAPQEVRCSRCGAVGEGRHPRAEARHLPAPPYSTSWAAAGPLCEEVRERGWRVEISESEQGWRAVFRRKSPPRADTPWITHVAVAPTMPAAAAQAGLSALDALCVALTNEHRLCRHLAVGRYRLLDKDGRPLDGGAPTALCAAHRIARQREGIQALEVGTDGT